MRDTVTGDSGASACAYACVFSSAAERPADDTDMTDEPGVNRSGSGVVGRDDVC